MISITKAQQIIQSHLPEPEIESCSLSQCMNRVLAEDISALEPMPGFTNSAMDGYAISLSEETESVELPLKLEIVGESRAGKPYEKVLSPGQAIIISTGAAVPKGTHQVIPVENTDTAGDAVIIHTTSQSDICP